MAQILPRDTIAERLGTGLGTGLQQGISSGLQSLLNDKLQKMSQQRLRTGLQPFFGEQADQYSNLPPELLAPLIKEKAREPLYKAEYDTIKQLLQPREQQNQQNNINQLLAPQEIGGKPSLPEGGMLRPGKALEIAKFQQNQQDLEERKKERERDFELRKQVSEQSHALKKQIAEQGAITQKENQELKREAQDLKQQAIIHAENKPYLDLLDKSSVPAQNINALAKQMKDLLNTNNVSTGFAGRYTPKQLQNFETQTFDAKANELAALIAGQGNGVATNFKIKLAQLTKPMIDQKRETQEQLLNDAIEKTEKVLQQEEARQEIIAGNGGLEPRNIKFLINEKIKTDPVYKYNLPRIAYDDGSDVKNGDIVQVADHTFERQNNKWIEV